MTKKKLLTIFSTIFAVSAAWLIFMGVQDVRVDYKYEREIGGFWSLADKASTLDQKSDYIDKYVAALESSGAMHGNNAIIFPTPDNELAKNMEAIRSLQTRLHQSRNMNPASFEYQQAIQQITAQEQGEARAMTSTLYNGWLLNGGYCYLWGWVWALLFLIPLALASISGFCICGILLETT